jgi:hypothetical protein
MKHHFWSQHRSYLPLYKCLRFCTYYQHISNYFFIIFFQVTTTRL